MGLTKQSTGAGVRKDLYIPAADYRTEKVIALAGNPNTGKSTVFNSLTGMNQHTGNWPGKTVTNALGRYQYGNDKYLLVDLPGTYSLLSASVEEEVARDFICFGQPDVTVVVADATCLERNLNLVLQILEITDRVVVCVNLMDEARRKKIRVDLDQLERELGVPVVGTNARNGEGLNALKAAIAQMAAGWQSHPRQVSYPQEIEAMVASLSPELAGLEPNSRWLALRVAAGETSIFASLGKYQGLDGNDFPGNENRELCRQTQSASRDLIVTSIISEAEKIYQKTVRLENEQHNAFDRKVDRILTSRIFGFPIMLGLLGLVFWLTLEGANYPSQLLAALLFGIEDWLSRLALWAYFPPWVFGILVMGMYRTLAWVVSVMLPPMAIFFPLFTLLEDLGYLPRVAFNLDYYFKKACAHGKQALTMCMGFGCNAAGVIACRIIDSPRERLIATITNNFVPCNGRFPILIVIASAFLAAGAGAFQSGIAVIAVMGVIVIGIAVTLAVSKILSKTILYGLPSSFTLEMPPYRKPQVGKVIVRSVFDRTLFVLGRAAAVAAPAGIVIWLMANITIADVSLLAHGARILQPLGWLMGLDGIILMGFLLGLPANEIVIPVIIMSYMASGSMQELESLEALRQLLAANGWTWLTAVNVMLFTLMHFPCGTTLWTIRKETQSLKWTWISFLVPTVVGIIICAAVAAVARLLGLVPM
jgi:ferrous iron transport protein B